MATKRLSGDKRPITFDYGDLGRNYWIDEEGGIRWDLIRINLDELGHFLQTVEGFIAREESQEVADIEREFGECVDWAEHYPWHWQDIIGSQLRQSYVVSLMSATEWHLKSICSEVNGILQAAVEPDDLKGGTLSRTRKFLTKIAKFSKPSTTMWDDVANIYLLRNILVHNTGMFDGEKKGQVAAIMRQFPGIKLESGFVRFGPKFCRSVHQRVEGFFKDLQGEYVRLCQRLARSESPGKSGGPNQH